MSDTTSEDRWVSAREAAEILGVGDRKFRELRRNGEIRERWLGYRTLRFSVRALQTYMHERSPSRDQ